MNRSKSSRPGPAGGAKVRSSSAVSIRKTLTTRTPVALRMVTGFTGDPGHRDRSPSTAEAMRATRARSPASTTYSRFRV